MHAGKCLVHEKEVSLQVGDGDPFGGDLFSAATDIEALRAEAAVCNIDRGAFRVDRAAAQLRAHPEVAQLLRFRVSELRVAMGLLLGQRDMARALLTRGRSAIGADS